MKLVRLIPAARSQTGTRLGYVCRRKNQGKCHMMQISISEPILRQTRWQHDQSLALAADVTAGIIALQAVGGKTKGSAHLRLTPSRRGNWFISWSGPIADLFPLTTTMTDLTLQEANTEHILFAIPTKLKP